MVIISVTKVGPLGFMCLDTDEAGGNMGLLDMVVALEVSLHLFILILILILIFILIIDIMMMMTISVLIIWDCLTCLAN